MAQVWVDHCFMRNTLKELVHMMKQWNQWNQSKLCLILWFLKGQIHNILYDSFCIMDIWTVYQIRFLAKSRNKSPMQTSFFRTRLSKLPLYLHHQIFQKLIIITSHIWWDCLESQDMQATFEKSSFECLKLCHLYESKALCSYRSHLLNCRRTIASQAYKILKASSKHQFTSSLQFSKHLLLYTLLLIR